MTDDERLVELYRKIWPQLKEAIPPGVGMSAPLLVKIPNEYNNTTIKLAIVGKETHSWDSWTGQEGIEYIDFLRDKYDKFERGRKWRPPFFQAARRLQSLVNPSRDLCAFIWLNVFVADQKRSLPSKEIADRLCEISFLPDEITILNPQAIVFFTGPSYDERLRDLFPDIEFLDHSRWIKIVRATGLPLATVRTYHPKFLRLRGHFDVIDEIAQLIKQLVGRPRS